MRYDDLALAVPRIMLPRADVNLANWAVIACDQHTSDPEYWDRVASHVGGTPSTLCLIYPEAHLDAPDRPARIESVRRSMQRYMDDGILEEAEEGFILVNRATAHAASRRGLMVALDLEQYSWEADATTLIRTTEGTVLERLPPRIEVRRGAPLESPHILVLIDDPQRTVIEPLVGRDLPLAYETDLMFGGGHVSGRWVQDPALIAGVVAALRDLRAVAAAQSDTPLLYAMGDGNHSFATARRVWDEIKDAAGGLEAVADHPARHALVELVNLHDEGLTFEPIHRVVFNVDHRALLSAMADFYRRQDSRVEIAEVEDRRRWQEMLADLDESEDHHLPFVAGGRDGKTHQGVMTIHEPAHALEAASLQQFLTDFGEQNGHLDVDYIHGVDATQRLGSKPGNVGLVSQVIDKHALFPTILDEGPLPRKSFSLGEAEEKRYYLECRRL